MNIFAFEKLFTIYKTVYRKNLHRKFLNHEQLFNRIQTFDDSYINNRTYFFAYSIFKIIF